MLVWDAAHVEENTCAGPWRRSYETAQCRWQSLYLRTMNEFEFKKGIEQIEGAKGYPPPEKLIVWLWREYRPLDPLLWSAACRVLTTYDKEARRFTNLDFKQAILDARNGIARDARQKERERIRAAQPPNGNWRRGIVGSMENADTPGQRAFFAEQLREYDAVHGTEHDAHHVTEKPEDCNEEDTKGTPL